jgi:chemotaxis protein MotA
MFVLFGWFVTLAAVFGVVFAQARNLGVIVKALPWETTAIGSAATGAFVATNQPKVPKATARGLGMDLTRPVWVWRVPSGPPPHSIAAVFRR